MVGDGERIVLVGGAPRSGTTLLQNILDSHPEIHGGPEFAHLPGVAHLHAAIQDGIAGGGLDHFVDAEAARLAMATLVESLLLPAADRAGKRLLAEKTPSNALVADRLLDLLPGARAVYIVRDPRGVVGSMLQVAERHAASGRPAPHGFQTPGQMVESIRAHLDGVGRAMASHPTRGWVVLYEQLVIHTETDCRHICEFLEVDFDPAMTRPASTDHAAAKLVDGVWYTDAEYHRDPDRSRVDGWRQTVPADIANEVADALAEHPVLVACGYEL